MQWSPDRNAGFSAGNPQQLFLPVIVDYEYHYEAVNVETSKQNLFSLFWWMKRMIALRQQTPAFARGSLRFLLPENNRVLAFLRCLDHQTILVVANLSRFAQFVELDLSEFRGCTPTELLGQTPFPRIGELPYFLTLGPHGFFWFAIQPAVEPSLTSMDATQPAAKSTDSLPMLRAKGPWQNVLSAKGKDSLTRILPEWLSIRRWFAGKSKTIRGTTLVDAVPLDGHDGSAGIELLFVQVEYEHDIAETYLLPVGFATGSQADQLVNDNSPALLAAMQVTGEGEPVSGVLYDAFGDERQGQILLEIIANRRRMHGRNGDIAGHPLRAFRTLRGPADDHLAVRLLKSEQSNSSLIYGDRLLLKLFRRLDEGTNPDLEIGRFLSESVRFPHSPAVAGSLDYHDRGGRTSTIGILQGYVRNEGDAWSYTLDNVHRFFDRVLSTRRTAPPLPADFPAIGLVAAAANPLPALTRELCNAYLESAGLIGQRTAELHLALASAPSDPQFAPEPLSELYLRSVYQGMRSLSRRTFRTLRHKIKDLSPELQDQSRTLLLLEQEVVDRFHSLVGRKLKGVRIRCHGDFHLGQVLFTGKDFVIIDFEGEPARRLSERRIKRSPIRDVAGMIRSFDYAAQTVLINHVAGIVHKDELSNFQAWARYWCEWTSTQFLASYLTVMRQGGLMSHQDDEVQMLLDAFLLEKAVYELAYELDHRPTWVQIPVSGILRLLNNLG